MLDGAEEPCDGMPLGRLTQILRCHMKINLGTRDLTVPEKIADGDEVDAFAHEMGGECVAQPMRAQSGFSRGSLRV